VWIKYTVFLLVFTVANCGNVTTRFEGTVYDSLTRTPLGGVTVSMEEADAQKVGMGNKLYVITTGSDGRYDYSVDNFVVFNGYCGPNALVRVSAANYQPQEYFMWSCTTTTHDFFLSP